MGVLGHADVHDIACKVGARDQFGVVHIGQRALISPFDSHLGQLRSHFPRTQVTATARLVQPRYQVWIVGIKPQAHDMHGATGEAHGDLCARDVSHAQVASGLTRPRLAR